MLYGHLVSTWAGLTAPLVHRGIVYVAGGITAHGGVRVLAIKVEDGSIVWQNNKAGRIGDEPEDGVRVAGQLCIVEDKLFLAADGPLYVAFDLKTGALKSSGSYDRQTLRGEVQGNLGGKWLVHGGPHNHSHYGRRYVGGRNTNLAISPIGADGFPERPRIDLGSRMQPPAWDERGIVVSHFHRFGLELWSIEQLGKKATAEHAKAKTKRRIPTNLALMKENLRGEAALKQTELAKWPTFLRPLSAVALAGNAVVAVHTNDEPQGRFQFSRMKEEKWLVTALNRSNGRVIWSVELPGEPIWDGLAIARNGSVLCSLRDGSIACIAGKQ